jgi:hypothetical protein
MDFQSSIQPMGFQPIVFELKEKENSWREIAVQQLIVLTLVITLNIKPRKSGALCLFQKIKIDYFFITSAIVLPISAGLATT